jgi:hypothetical protein
VVLDSISLFKFDFAMVESFEGGSTPRHWSPCGTCLDAGVPVLYSYPERHFTYLQEVATPIVEALVIPMFANPTGGATIWIVSHSETRFDAEDVRVMTTLGNFASRAVSIPNADGSLQEQSGHDLRGDSGKHLERLYSACRSLGPRSPYGPL